MITSSPLELLLRLIPERLVAVAVGMSVLAGASFGEEGTDRRKSALAPVISEARDNEAMIAVARERAKLLHEVYESTLDVMHHRYFRQDGPVLPSRALEDVFEEMEAANGDKANWIAVNTKAMSINHEAKTAFEKTAVAELAAGKDSYEEVDKGVYYRAAPIPLRLSCVGCHTKMSSGFPKTPRFAGLVIRIPLKAERK